MNLRCPTCDRPMEIDNRSEWPALPFCSTQCRLIDLGRWLGERYSFRPEDPVEQTVLPDDEYSIP
jgi:endogenous inhibitor of DNA gyrase (YacG/DUF329 family)